MGLIKAGIGSAGGVLAEQWKEFIYCESIDEDVLLTKGQKKIGRRNVNDKSEIDVISNGSKVAINAGQCMIIVEQGKVVDMCAEPGEYIYKTDIAPSIFAGSFGDSVKQSFKELGKRFSFGASPGKDQRVYFINTKEIVGNKYGTPQPIPFRVVDKNVGLDIDIAIKCFGEYSYKVKDPIIFYTNVAGNVSDEYRRDEIDSQLKSELMTALQPAFAEISAEGIRYSELPAHTDDLALVLNNILSEKWHKLRGLEVYSFGVSSVKAPEEDEKMIKELQRNAAFRNPGMAAAQLVGAQSQAMQDAAKNEGAGGAFMGFAGMNMAQNSGNMNTNQLYQMQEQQNAQAQTQGNNVNGASVSSGADSWTCECGTSNTGKFCSNCGKAKPVSNEWACPKCSTVNTGKFCSNCGTAKPVSNEWTCPKCSTVNTGKFCSNCGTARP